jgi:hypothetical protein
MRWALLFAPVIAAGVAYAVWPSDALWWLIALLSVPLVVAVHLLDQPERARQKRKYGRDDVDDSMYFSDRYPGGPAG